MYQTDYDGKHYELGTSGFLYRSNKLMYDDATSSLWSTLTGEPVVGPLVGQGIQLQRSYVVTTTWAEWKRRHPETSVLSLDTGYPDQDYGEGVAYRDYFSTHNLMFPVPAADDRLRNKTEVLALREGNEQLAISATFLQEHSVFHETVGGQEFVVLTDASGANRVYESTGIRFESYDGNETAVDSQSRSWKVASDSLSMPEQSLKRLPAHRAFWFGWFAQFPETRLIK